MTWLHSLWFHYFVPSLWGNGPEALIEMAAVGIVGALIWPRVRHAVETFVKRHLHSGNAELHRKLDHIIDKHPDIPDLEDE